MAKVSSGGKGQIIPDDSEFIRERRVNLDAGREEQRQARHKELHWMRCSRCGGTVQEISFKGIMVDRCQDCGGVFFDINELKLLSHEDSSFLKSMVDFFQIGGP